MADEITRLIYTTSGGRAAIAVQTQLAASAANAAREIERLQRVQRRGFATGAGGLSGVGAVGIQNEARQFRAYRDQLVLIDRSQRNITNNRFGQSVRDSSNRMREGTRAGGRFATSLFAVDTAAHAARGNIRGLAQDARGLRGARGFGGLGAGAAAGLGAVAAVGILTAVGGEKTIGVERRVRLFVDSQKEAVNVTRELFEVTKRNRQALSSVLETYQGVARGAERYALSQQTVLRVTEAVSAASRISGGPPGSASASVVQLSQALSSGELRGQELRSVLEQNPRLAQAIADGLSRLSDKFDDLDTGDLLKLGESGELRTGEILAALRLETPRLIEENKSLNLTIGEATRVLGASLLQLGGEINRVIPLTESIAALLKGGANLAGAGAGLVGQIRAFDRSAAGFVRSKFESGVAGAMNLNGGDASIEDARQLIQDIDKPFKDLLDAINKWSNSLPGANNVTSDVQAQLNLFGKTLKNEVLPASRGEISAGTTAKEARNLEDELLVGKSAAIDLQDQVQKINDTLADVPSVSFADVFGGVDFDTQVARVAHEIELIEDRLTTISQIRIDRAISETVTPTVDKFLRGQNQTQFQLESIRNGDSVETAQREVALLKERATLQETLNNLRKEAADAGIPEDQLADQIETINIAFNRRIELEDELKEAIEQRKAIDSFEGRLDTLAQSAELELQLLDLRKEDRDVQRTIIPLRQEADQLGIENGQKRVNALEKELDLIRQRQEVEAAAEKFANITGDFLGDLVTDFDNAGDAALKLANQLADVLLQYALIEPFKRALTSSGSDENSFIGSIISAFATSGTGSTATPAATGGVFPMASGGMLVRRPMTFPMASGGSVRVGESGEEGVFPVQRGRDGSLSIRGDSGGGGTSRVVVLDSSEIDRRIAQGEFDKSLGRRINTVGSPLNASTRRAGQRRR